MSLLPLPRRVARRLRPALRGGALALLAMLLLIGTPGAQALAQATPTAKLLVAEPLAPGGTLLVSGYNLPPGATLRLRVPAPAARVGELPVDTRGIAAPARFAMPAELIPGTYTLEALSGRDLVAIAPLRVYPPPNLTLTPNAGGPGTVVQVSVTNLLGDALRVDLGEVTVIGPVAITGGSYTGAFVLPRGTPPGPLTVTALTVSGTRLVGKARAPFQAQAAPPAYQLVDLSIAERDLRPGGSFTLRGRIDPAPRGPLGDFSLSLAWKSAEGASVPVARGPAQIAADGSFSMAALVPSLLRGDPFAGTDADQLILTLQHAIEGTATASYRPGESAFQKVYGLKFAVVRASDGQPIIYQPPQTPGDPPALYARVDPLYINDAFDYNLLLTGASGEDLNAIPAIMAMQIQKLNNQGDDCLKLPTFNGDADVKFWEWGINPWDAARFQTSGVPLPATLRIQPAAQADARPAAEPDPEMVIIYRIFVDASRVKDAVTQHGYGLRKVVGGVTYALAYNRLYLHLPHRNKLYLIDEETGLAIDQAPLATIELDVLPENAKGSVEVLSFRVDAVAPTGATTQSGDTFRTPYGPFLSFSQLVGPNQPNPISFTGQSLDVKLEIVGVKEAIDSLVGTNVSLSLNNQPLESAVVQDGQCSAAGLKGALLVEFIQPYATFTPGSHTIRAVVGGTAGQIHELKLGFVPPPAWISQAPFSSRERSVNWRPAAVTLSAKAFEPDQTEMALGAAVEYAGDLNNQTQLDGDLVEVVTYPATSGARVGGGRMDSLAMNNGAAPATIDGSGAASLAGTTTIELLDTGKIRIFEVGYGIPKIAWLYLGIDLRITASTTINTTFNLDSLQMDVKNIYDATVFVEIVAGAELFAGIAEASFSFGSAFGAQLHTQHTLAKPFQELLKCFYYRLYVHYEIELFWGLFSVAEDTIPIFDAHTPSGCFDTSTPLPFAKPAENLLQQAGAGPRSAFYASPALASDGLGHTVAVWRGTGGRILASQHSGAGWLPPTPISEIGAGSPAIAFYAPGRAIAAWSQTGVPADERTDLTRGALAAFILQRQHLVYALWDGVGWSEPQSLTVPTTGDGRVALAGCIATDPDCPEAGEVTAVWVRDMAGAIEQRRFRIFRSTFRPGAGAGTGWGPAVAVDSNDAVTDTEPSVTYLRGVPVVAWVRDTQRKAAPAYLRSADRRLALRFLDGSSPLRLPDLPAGIVDPVVIPDQNGDLQIAYTVASDADGIVSNRRALHRALGRCGGDSSCTWQGVALRDSKGRTIFAESPALSLDAQGELTLVARVMGYDPIVNPPTPVANLAAIEPIGIQLGTGELGQLALPLDLEAPIGLIEYLSESGALNAKPAVVYAAELNANLVLAIEGPAPPLGDLQLAQASGGGQRAARVFAGEPLIGLSAARLPNFALRELGAISQDQAGTLSVRARVQNTGTAWAGGPGAPLLIGAAWEGPRGSLPAGQASLAALGAGESRELTISLAPPPARSRAQTLRVTVNTGRPVEEQTARDNSRTALWQAIARPPAPQAHAPAGQPLVQLSWPAASDPRVTAYRIYRALPGGAAEPAGVSYGTSWADLHAPPGATVRYRIAGLGVDLSETGLSDEVSVRVDSVGGLLYLPLLRR